MSQCRIHIENHSSLYYAGSEIRGRVECNFNKEKTVRGIKIRIKCREYNSWMGTESYTDPVDHKTKTRTITLVGDNTILNLEQMLFGSGSGSRSLPRGHHVYAFSFRLPTDIPSSFTGPHGSVSYKLKAVVDIPMGLDYEDDYVFVVVSPIDFNKMSTHLQDISTYSDEKTVCCCCCAGGDITMEVELPKIAFIPSEVVPFKVKISNLSNSNVENLTVKLVKKVTYRVTSPHSEHKSDEDHLISFSEHGVGAHGEHTYNLELRIPHDVQVPNFDRCGLFSANYEVKVCACMPSCTLDLEVSAWDVQLGHIQAPQTYVQGGGDELPGPAPSAPPVYGFMDPNATPSAPFEDSGKAKAAETQNVSEMPPPSYQQATRPMS